MNNMEYTLEYLFPEEDEVPGYSDLCKFKIF